MRKFKFIIQHHSISNSRKHFKKGSLNFEKFNLTNTNNYKRIQTSQHVFHKRKSQKFIFQHFCVWLEMWAYLNCFEFHFLDFFFYNFVISKQLCAIWCFPKNSSNMSNMIEYQWKTDDLVRIVDHFYTKNYLSVHLQSTTYHIGNTVFPSIIQSICLAWYFFEPRCLHRWFGSVQLLGSKLTRATHSPFEFFTYKNFVWVCIWSRHFVCNEFSLFSFQFFSVSFSLFPSLSLFASHLFSDSIALFCFDICN